MPPGFHHARATTDRAARVATDKGIFRHRVQ